MIFCGQCGLQLNVGDTQCPRCGAAVEAGIPTTEESHPNAPTVEAASFLARHPSPGTQQPAGSFIQNDPQPQKLVLRPEPGADGYNAADAHEATRRVEQIPMGSSYPGLTQGGANLPSRGTSFTGFPQQSGGNYPQMGASYPGFVPSASTYHAPAQAQATQNTKGRSAALIIILIGLLFVLTSLAMIILQHNGVI